MDYEKTKTNVIYELFIKTKSASENYKQGGSRPDFSPTVTLCYGC